jgi:hypothetical protein
LSGHRRCRAIREVSDEEEDETFLRTLKFKAVLDPEILATPLGERMGGRPGSLVAEQASPN